jgi:hypothetical protein
MPGEYTVRLTVDGHSYTQPLTVKMDPRVKTTLEGLAQQSTLSLQACADMRQANETLSQIRALRVRLRVRLKQLREDTEHIQLAKKLEALDVKVAALAGPIENSGRRGRGRGVRGAEPTLMRLHGELGQLLETLQAADATPTTQTVAACGQVHQALSGPLARWTELKSEDVKTVNELLRQANLPSLTPDEP